MRKRIFGYDLIKSLAMTMVVFYHIANIDLGNCIIGDSFHFTVSKYLYGLLSAGVPLFFMVNGAVSALRPITFQWSIRKSLRLIWVASFWTIIIRCLIYPFFFNIPLLNTIIDFRNFYWFLYTLATLYPIVFFLQKHLVLRNSILFSLCLFPFLSNFVWDIVIFVRGNDIFLPLWGHTGFFTLYSLIYYYLGRFSSRIFVNRYICILLAVVGLLLINFEVYSMSNYFHEVYDGVNACFPTVGALLLSLGLFLLLKDYQPKPIFFSKIISLIGGNTISIYIFHLLLLPIISIVISYNGAKPPIFVFVEALLVVFICAFFSNFLSRSSFQALIKL